MRLLSRIALGLVAAAFALTLDPAGTLQNGDLSVKGAWAKHHHKHKHHRKHHRARHRHKKKASAQTEM